MNKVNNRQSISDMSKRLKTCSCGGNVELKKYSETFDDGMVIDGYYARCKKCKKQGIVRFYPQDAVNAWNNGEIL